MQLRICGDVTDAAMLTIAMPFFTAIQGTRTVTKSTITIAKRGRCTDGNDVRTNGDDGITLRQDDDPMSLGGGCVLTLLTCGR